MVIFLPYILFYGIIIDICDLIGEVKEMKKLAGSLLAATLLFSSMNLVADASVEQLRDKLVSLGVPAESANQLLTYLQTIDLSDKDKAEIEALVKEAYAVIGDVTDLTTLSASSKQTLIDLATKASGKVGLTLKYDIVDGVKTITLTSANGQPVFSLSATDIAEVLTNFDGDMVGVIETILEATVETVVGTNTPGTNGGNQPSVQPMPDTNLNDTGYELPTIVMAGTGLIVLAGSLMMVSRRQMQE